MTILLTGGCGYIGSHAAVEMMAAGCDVILADDFKNSSRSIPMRIWRITGKLPASYEINVCDMESLDKVFGENNIDCVIHFVGTRSISDSFRSPMRCCRNNLDSVLSVLEAMDKHSCKSFVYCSSAAVYGPSAAVPYSELEPITDAASPYGRAVITAERLIEDAARSRGISAVILRCFNVAGAHPSGIIGELPRQAPTNLLPQLTRVASGELQVFHIWGDDYPTPDGTGVRDYVHVMDIARACMSAAEYAQTHEGCLAVNLGTGKGTSVLEMLSIFERTTGVEIPCVVAPKREGEAAECISESVRSIGVLDWQPEFTVEDICRDAWNWQRHLTEMNQEWAEREVI